MNKFKALFGIVVLFTLFLAGCGLMEPDGSEAETGINDSNGESVLQGYNLLDIHLLKTYCSWNQAVDVTQLGKSITELSEPAIHYELYADGAESVSHEASYLFSDRVWADGSYCTAISSSLGIDGSSTEQIMEAVGASWTANAAATEHYYYGYVQQSELADGFEGGEDRYIEIRIDTDAFKNLDGHIIFKLPEAESMIGTKEAWQSREVRLSTERGSASWQKMNEYIDLIGVPEEELKSYFSQELERIDYPLSYYSLKDNLTGAEMFITDGTCDLVEIPTEIIFGERGSVNYWDLVELWQGPVSWSCYESPVYIYYFEDVTVYVDTDRLGNVKMDGGTQEDEGKILFSSSIYCSFGLPTAK